MTNPTPASNSFWKFIERSSWVLSGIVGFIVAFIKEILPQSQYLYLYKNIAIGVLLICAVVFFYNVFFWISKSKYEKLSRFALSLIISVLLLIITKYFVHQEALKNTPPIQASSSPTSTLTPNSQSQGLSSSAQQKPVQNGSSSEFSILPVNFADSSFISQELYFHPLYGYAGIKITFSETEGKSFADYESIKINLSMKKEGMSPVLYINDISNLQNPPFRPVKDGDNTIFLYQLANEVNLSRVKSISIGIPYTETKSLLGVQINSLKLVKKK